MTSEGVRRSFLKLLPNEEKYLPFSKSSFTDIESVIDFRRYPVKVDKYKKVLLAGCLVNKNEDRKLINGWLALYASMRGWPTNAERRRNVDKAIADAQMESHRDDFEKVTELLDARRFVVLQGAPGVGKTYLAERISQERFDKTFFTQFHAETSYSDFIVGILPALDKEEVTYRYHYGVLVDAIVYAKSHPKERVLLIIDEINRANLASMMGPVFYLFEPSRKNSKQVLRLGNTEVSQLPENLYVLPTMNTADRNLAVVDFALRRRFAWYEIEPHHFGKNEKGKLYFYRIASIFEKYATRSELNLQPGGAYFMGDDEEVDQKLEYEVMPLIREYLEQGFLGNSEQEFDSFFYTSIGKHLFR